MLLLFSVYLLSAPLPALAFYVSSTSSSCKDIDNCRTLLGIIWSCITTIFLCTWGAIHPNIPEPVETQRMGIWRKYVHKTLHFFRNKVTMFIYALLVPEYILAWAIRQHLMARKIVKENVDLELTRTHAFFIIMGGFHCFEGSDKAGDLYEAKHPLTCTNVLSMLRNNALSLPTEEEIQDRSKSDWLAKTIVFLQTLWFVTQFIARGIEKLPTTELEIITLAYTAIYVGMFIAWWDKPRNVDRPIRVFHKPVEMDKATPRDWFEVMISPIVGIQDRTVNLHERANVPMFYSGKPKETEIFPADGITMANGVVFGAIHCIAWFFDFSSHTGLFLWRLSSVAITAVPALLTLSLVLVALVGKYGGNEGSVFTKRIIVGVMVCATILMLLMPLLGLLYVAARLATLFLALMNLASLPPGEFQAVHWTTLIAHL